MRSKIIKIKYIFIIFILLSSTIYAEHLKGKKIAKIPEASGISYCSNTHTLMVANDEGIYYEIDTKGRVLKKVNLGSYDLEGIVCEDEKLIFAIENKGVLLVNRRTGKKTKTSIDRHYNGKRVKLFNKKAGIEGIEKVNNYIYLAKQSKKRKTSFIAVVELISNKGKIVDIIEHNIVDTAGLSYFNGYLYMVSDKKDLLIKYDLEKKKIIEKIKLAKGAWEGITFDKKGNMYLADDDGWVVKFDKID